MQQPKPHKLYVANEYIGAEGGKLFGTYIGWLQQILNAKKAGWDGLEVAPFTLGMQPRDFIESGGAAQYVAALDKNGLEKGGGHWLLTFWQKVLDTIPQYSLLTKDADFRKEGQQFFRSVIDLVYELGGRYLMHGSPPSRNRSKGMKVEQATELTKTFLTDEFKDSYDDKVIRLTDYLEEKGMKLAFEALRRDDPTNFMNTIIETLAVVNYINSEVVGLGLDAKAQSGEHIIYPRGREKDFARFKEQVLERAAIVTPQQIADSILGIPKEDQGKVYAVHVNRPDLKPAGTGDFDFTPFFLALYQIGYQGQVTSEPFKRFKDYLDIVVEAEIGQKVLRADNNKALDELLLAAQDGGKK